MRAYGGSAAECLRLAARQPLLRMVEFVVVCEFPDIGSVHALLAAFSAEKCGERFDADGARLHLRVAEARAADLKTRLRDATRNRVRIEDR